MVSRDSAWTDCAFTGKDGSLNVISWNIENWYYDYSKCEEVADREMDCVVVELDKRVVCADGDAVDENEAWGLDIFRKIAVSLDQKFLLTNGMFRKASDLVAGVDCVQSKCGNGHFSRVVSVTPCGKKVCRGAKTFPHGTIVVAGVVMAAENHG